MGGKLRNVMEYSLTSIDMEQIHGESMTVPDEAYTIKQLLAKYAAGNMPPVERAVTYMNDVDFDSHDVEKLKDADIFDRMEVASNEKQLTDTILAKAKEKPVKPEMQAKTKEEGTDDPVTPALKDSQASQRSGDSGE